MKDGKIIQIGAPEQILTSPVDRYVERFIEGVDCAKVRLVEAVMAEPKETALETEGPRVVLRRMKRAGLSSIFVVGEERKSVGICEAEEVARLIERGDDSLSGAIDRDAPRVRRATPLRDVLPLFVERDLPVAVTGEGGRLEGSVVRGSLIAGLTSGTEPKNGESPEVGRYTRVGDVGGAGG